MKKCMRPALGLLQGCILYWLFTQTQLSNAGLISASIVLTFPLFAMQVKLPNKNTLVLGLSLLVIMALIYGYIAYYLVNEMEHSSGSVAGILAVQCSFSAFVMFIFYCVAIEEKGLSFPYATLFSESWQVIFKLSLGKLLVLLTWGLFLLASLLFQLLNISIIHQIVSSKAFSYTMLPCFFGIAMTILYEYEDILTKLRNILLAFCTFLYPLFIVISLSFMLVAPFSDKKLADFWVVITVLSTLNIVLFNGIFQAGPSKPPYSRWFCNLIYASMIMTFIYSMYVLQFPWKDMNTYGIKPLSFLSLVSLIILALYNFCYSLAIFYSKKPWLNMIKILNTSLALLVALLYLGMALPWFNIGKIAANFQIKRLLTNQTITNAQRPSTSPAYLAGANLSGVNLRGKELRYTDFSNANLDGANFSGADLAYATLKGTNLHKANLSGANLDGAYLNETNLSQANLNGAKFNQVWFNHVNLDQADLSNTDLSKMYNLQQTTVNGACGKNVLLPLNLTIKPCKKNTH